MRRALATIVWLVLAGALLAPGASAGVYQQVLEVYQREGSIPPCAFTGPQLQRALGGVDTYGAQYFADFTQAVQTALTARAGGACAVTAPRADGAAAGGDRGPVPPPPTIALTAASQSGVPLPMALLGAAVLTGALVLAGVAVLRRAADR